MEFPLLSLLGSFHLSRLQFSELQGLSSSFLARGGPGALARQPCPRRHSPGIALPLRLPGAEPSPCGGSSPWGAGLGGDPSPLPAWGTRGHDSLRGTLLGNGVPVSGSLPNLSSCSSPATEGLNPRRRCRAPRVPLPHIPWLSAPCRPNVVLGGVPRPGNWDTAGPMGPGRRWKCWQSNSWLMPVAPMPPALHGASRHQEPLGEPWQGLVCGWEPGHRVPPPLLACSGCGQWPAPCLSFPAPLQRGGSRLPRPGSRCCPPAQREEEEGRGCASSTLYFGLPCAAPLAQVELGRMPAPSPAGWLGWTGLPAGARGCCSLRGWLWRPHTVPSRTPGQILLFPPR